MLEGQEVGADGEEVHAEVSNPLLPRQIQFLYFPITQKSASWHKEYVNIVDLFGARLILR